MSVTTVEATCLLSFPNTPTEKHKLRQCNEILIFTVFLPACLPTWCEQSQGSLHAAIYGSVLSTGSQVRVAPWHKLIARDICWQRCISLCVKSPLWGGQTETGRVGGKGREGCSSC